jgi:alpha-galactosidase
MYVSKNRNDRRAGKKIRATPTVSIPKDVVPVDVPLDPALAIHKRFGTLITQKTD